MLPLVVIVVFSLCVIVGQTIGARYSVAPPVLLIVFGAALGLIPALGDIELEPDVVLLLFLPAILYWESLNTSIREIRANLRVIVLSAVVLVIATAAAVAGIAMWLGMDPHAAWVLGAVLAPTDAAAIAGLAKRMPRRTLTTLRAESLINDGTALVLFAVTVSVATGEADPGPWEIGWRFLGSYGGGIAAGLVVGYAVIGVRRRLDEPLREGALSVVTPFAAFLLAEEVHASGVVAVVTAGLLLTTAGPRVIRARSRVQAYAFWDLATFLVNGSLFVLVGVQVPGVVDDLEDGRKLHALWVALVLCAVVVGTRLAWVHVSAMVIRTLDRRPVQRLRRATWQTRTAVGWAGFRGAVSLAAALAVPDDVADRDLIVFTTVVVILLTIIVQGTTLPAVVRWARLPEDTARAEEVHLARVRATEAALEALPGVAGRLGVDGDLLDRIRAEYEEHARDLEVEYAEDGDTGAELRELDRQLRLDLLQHKRQAIIALRDGRQIDDIVLREIQAQLDIEEVRLLGPASAD
ncbi:Na+/H+ antiporter [Blastococcus sp. TF02A-26]|uniref:Na+/H+ antiporter n=1 Tax=Blastococcus sp. TF02A-26 TaxID=2250577 RepID=UPI000DEBC372|nr:Na+/H+ antiporter [Blastococcus sp. TF02A-26]RBY85216.1 Na+/H+ antiporter [Blastococcus sp. TF02A-26]